MKTVKSKLADLRGPELDHPTGEGEDLDAVVLTLLSTKAEVEARVASYLTAF